MAGSAPGLDGDGGPALNAKFNGPFGITFDRAGNLYIVDGFNGLVRKVSPQGMVTRYAGSRHFSGDGGQAAEALLFNPTNPAFEARGNLLFADQNNHLVRRIDGSGVINSAVGTGTAGYSGDSGQALKAEQYSPREVVSDKTGNLFISEYGNFTIRKVTASGLVSTYAGDPTAPNAAALLDGPAQSFD